MTAPAIAPAPAALGPSIAGMRRLQWDLAASIANAASATHCHYGTAGCHDESDGSHECRVVPPFEVLAEVESRASGGYVDHVVAFSRPVTLAEFRAYVEARRWFGYDPRGYGGTATVFEKAGCWRRFSSCD